MSESTPYQACLLPWEQGVGGGTEGQGTTFFIFIILSTPPARQGCLFMGHICWLAGDMSLVRKNAWESPRSQESRAHSFRDWPLPLL